VVWLDLEAPSEELRRVVVASPHTRFPVCRGELDRVVGVAQAKDLLEQCLSGRPIDLAAAVRPLLLVPEATGALRLLERFREAGEQMAIVVDEYGGVAGVVTLQDVLEAIIGDLPTADGHRDPRAVRRPDGSWLLDGTLPTDEAAELLGLADLPGEHLGYRTLAGFILAQLARIPEVGDAFEAGGWRFDVADMDGNRVDRVLATPVGDTVDLENPPTATTD
jgi:putative hemolysin